MTALVDLVNQSLQVLGTRTTVTATELANNSSNEAIQANIAYNSARQDLLRMAPWDCGLTTSLLTYITSSFGTPENPITPTSSYWFKGLPAPPWAYEYQYPVDCLRACWITPQYATGFSGGIPITTAITGGSPSFWDGMPVRFKVAVDQFYSISAATVAAGGSGYAVGDTITLATTPANTNPIGAPAQLVVATVSGSAVATVTVVNQLNSEVPSLSGSYFTKQTAPIAQSSTTGAGTGATFNVTWSGPSDQRVILTNQEFAIMNYIRDVTDINVFDPLFITALRHVMAAKLAMALTGKVSLANEQINLANARISEARAVDGNEGLTINDVTPDFIRIRGVIFADGFSSPGFDWGNLWPAY